MRCRSSAANTAPLCSLIFWLSTLAIIVEGVKGPIPVTFYVNCPAGGAYVENPGGIGATVMLQCCSCTALPQNITEYVPGTAFGTGNGVSSWEYSASLPALLVTGYTDSTCGMSGGLGTKGFLDSPDNSTSCHPTSTQAQAYDMLAGQVTQPQVQGAVQDPFDNLIMSAALDNAYCGCA